MEPGDLKTHFNAKRCVQVRQRFIEQEGTWLANNGAADGHPLALSTRKRLGAPVEIFVQLQHFSSRIHLAVDLRLGKACRLQTETDILAHRHMRVKRVGLEDHRQSPPRWRQCSDVLAIDLDSTTAGFLKP